MAESSSISKRPQLKYSFSSNNIFPESPKNQQINQSPLSYTPQENNDNPIHHKKSKSNTFSSIFSNSRSSSFMRRRRTEYQENYEFNNGCFGFLCTIGSKIKYKINNTWKGVKSKCKGKFNKKRSLDQDDWKSKAMTLNQF